MKIKYLLLGPLIALGTAAHAQNAPAAVPEGRTELRTNFYYRSHATLFNSPNIIGPAVGMATYGRRNWYEAELSYFRLNTGQNDAVIGISRNDISGAARFQSNRWLTRKENANVRIYAGVGLWEEVTRITARPLQANMFATSYTASYTQTYVAPGAQVKLSNRLTMDISVPITFITLVYTANVVENPAWSRREQRNDEFRFDMFSPGGIQTRVGLGYTL